MSKDIKIMLLTCKTELSHHSRLLNRHTREKIHLVLFKLQSLENSKLGCPDFSQMGVWTLQCAAASSCSRKPENL